MIVCKLSRILGEKRWTQKKLAKATGIRPNTINALYHGYATRISFEHMDRICKALGCEPSDLFVLVPDKDDPIRVLRKRDNSKNQKPPDRCNGR